MCKWSLKEELYISTIILLQVMIQKQNRHMSMSLYLATLAVTDTIVLVSGENRYDQSMLQVTYYIYLFRQNDFLKKGKIYWISCRVQKMYVGQTWKMLKKLNLFF